MKKLILLPLFLVLGPVAQADIRCETADKQTTIEFAEHWAKGWFAEMESKPVSRHYKAADGLEIKRILTMIDPESGKPVAEVNPPQYTFGVYAPDSGTDMMWNLTIEMGGNPSARLTDFTGKTFEFKLECKTLPSLE